ncbi:esterase/lipase family protein [Algoriphagus pacificus]|uniref:Alpha/beta hydrolase family protein n=1 Tax=Algoriphagus pacificus TaxID=2811234 RepID=A0ABS3CL05_9BACT|nr:hypothetical protein [Algoriphagus pacificus]MBN7817789.1 hypothetical protein [Algoriphagus pacificus]
MKRVILIHGTFAKNAEWIQKDSSFQLALMKSLKSDVIFSKFDWDGKNCHSSRINYGDKLRIVLEKSLLNNPNDEHILIAHSHGGNVAMYALSKMKNSFSNVSLVTLATPFIRCEKFEISGISGILMIIGIISFFTAMFYLPNQISLEIEGPFSFLNGPIRFIKFAIAFLIAKGLIKIKAFIISEFQEYVNLFYKKIDYRKTELKRMLVVRIEGDEALLWLRISSFLQKVTSKFGERATKLSFLSFGYLYALLFTISIIVILLGELTFNKINLSFLDLEEMQIVYLIIFVLFLILLIFPALVFIISLPILYLFRGNPLIFGWENFFKGLSLSIYPSQNPPDEITYDVLSYPSDIKRVKGLLHSQPYLNSEIITKIGLWIEG